MAKYCFIILVGILTSSHSIARTCKSECLGADYYERHLRSICHRDCFDVCSTTNVQRNAPQCIDKIRSEIEFLNEIIEKSEANASEVISIGQ